MLFSPCINLPPNWARQEGRNGFLVRGCLPVLPRLVEVLGLAATHSSSLIITPRFTARHRHFLPSTRLEVSSLARQLSPLVFHPAGFSVISFPPRQTASAGSILPKFIGFQKARSYANCRRGAFWIRQRKSPDSLSLDHSPVFDRHLHFSHLPRVSAPPGQACRVSSAHTLDRAALLTRGFTAGWL